MTELTKERFTKERYLEFLPTLREVEERAVRVMQAMWECKDKMLLPYKSLEDIQERIVHISFDDDEFYVDFTTEYGPEIFVLSTDYLFIDDYEKLKDELEKREDVFH
jgi:hypothetical protein